MRYGLFATADEAQPFEEVPAHALGARIAELSGRNAWGYRSVRERLRRSGSVYIAAAADHRSDVFGAGFIVRRLAA